MSNLSSPVASEGSYLTLHYRLSPIEGDDFVSTFGGNPATLQLGAGQLAGPLEVLLVGMTEGQRQLFKLSPGEAFGPRNSELIQQVSLETLQKNSQLGAEYKVGDVVEFNAPDGGQFAGLLNAINGDNVLFDFNHPLAGQSVHFEVEIISIL